MAPPKSPNDETQSQMAARMYNARAQVYDDSHHPAFTSWLVKEMLQPKPGEQILDLACGTGGVSFPAAEAVKPEGSVTGVDVAGAMLLEAEKKFFTMKEQGQGLRLQFIKHDITDLNSCVELKGREGSFDAIVIASALVLLRDPWEAVREWVYTWLKPGGRIVTDAPHPNNYLEGMVLERTYRRLGISPPYNRLWMKGGDSLKQLFTDLGLEIEKITFKSQLGIGTRYWAADDAEEKVKTGIMTMEPARRLRAPDIVDRATTIFKEEWINLANEEGKIEDVDGVFVCVARSAASREPRLAVVRGSCACGNVTWQSTKLPTDLTFCHCITCRKASGGPFLAFADFAYAAVTINSRPDFSYKTVALSKSAIRGFCGNCGSCLSMRYFAELENIGMTAASIDNDTHEGGQQIFKGIRRKHIYIRDAVSWYSLPEDGLERQQTMNGANFMLAFDV